MRLLSVTAILLLLLVSGVAVRASTAPADLQDAVHQATTLLEDKQYDAFLVRFVDPDDLANFLKGHTQAELSQEFAKDKAAQLTSFLKSIGDVDPVMSEEGTVATFDLKGQPRPLIMRKVNGQWYIKN